MTFTRAQESVLNAAIAALKEEKPFLSELLENMVEDIRNPVSQRGPARTLANQDWDAVRQEYENGKLPLLTICSQFGVNVNTLYKRMALEGWTPRNRRRGERS